MKFSKQKTAMLSSLLAMLLVTPLIANAAVYYSHDRANLFRPAAGNHSLRPFCGMC